MFCDRATTLKDCEEQLRAGAKTRAWSRVKGSPGRGLVQGQGVIR